MATQDYLRLGTCREMPAARRLVEQDVPRGTTAAASAMWQRGRWWQQRTCREEGRPAPAGGLSRQFFWAKT